MRSGAECLNRDMNPSNSTVNWAPSSVRIHTVAGLDQPESTPELHNLYRGFEKEHLVPLRSEIGDPMPPQPEVQGDPTPVGVGQRRVGRARRRPRAPLARR